MAAYLDPMGDEEYLEPSLRNILELDSLKWVSYPFPIIYSLLSLCHFFLLTVSAL